MKSDEKPSTTKIQSCSLVDVKNATKRALQDYEEKRRQLHPEFDVYEFLHDTLKDGYSSFWVRKAINPFIEHFFEPQRLVVVCKLIEDKRPIQILIQYLQGEQQ